MKKLQNVNSYQPVDLHVYGYPEFKIDIRNQGTLIYSFALSWPLLMVIAFTEVMLHMYVDFKNSVTRL